MIFAAVAASFALLVLLVCAALLYGRRISLAAASDLATALHPIDIRAFQTLLDSDDLAFLAANLPASEFRRLRRQQIAVVISYLRLVASNAQMLMAVPQLCSEGPVKAQAERLASEALRIRILALRAIARLAFCYCFVTEVEAPNLAGYTLLRMSFESLVRSII